MSTRPRSSSGKGPRPGSSSSAGTRPGSALRPGFRPDKHAKKPQSAQATQIAEGPAYVAKLCARRPIHFIVLTLLLASLAYLGLFDNYLSQGSLTDASSATFYNSPATNGASWDFVSNATQFEQLTAGLQRTAGSGSGSSQAHATNLSAPGSFSDLSFNSTPHWSLTPIVFKANQLDPVYPNCSTLIDSADGGSGGSAQEKYFLTKFPGNLPESFTAPNGDVYKVRASSRFGRYYENVKNLSRTLKNAAEGAEPFDFFLIALAYAAMAFTIAQLFYQMRASGSNFWLAFGSLLSSFVSFIFALAFTTQVLHIDISPSSITEGMPFLGAALGFSHKITYTLPAIESIEEHPDDNISDTIEDVVKNKTGWPLIKQQLSLAGAFLIAAALVNNMTALRNFCILVSVLMVSDLIGTFSFYSAVISLKAQIQTVHRQIQMSQQLEDEGVSRETALSVARKDIRSQSKYELFSHDKSVVGFKVAMAVGLVALQLLALATSWLYDDYSDYQPSETLIKYASGELSSGITSKIPLGVDGTLVTLMSAKIYRRVTWLTTAEDAIFDTVTQVSRSIRDPYVSKMLFVVAGISVAINIYLLNVAREHLRSEKYKAPSQNKLFSSSSSSSKKLPHTPRSTSSGTFSTPSSPRKKVSSPQKAPTPIAAAVAKEASVVASDATTPTTIGAVPSLENIKDVEILDESTSSLSTAPTNDTVRPLAELVDVMKAGNLKECNDTEVVELCAQGKLPLYALEKQLEDATRAVIVRRRVIADLANAPVLETDRLPYEHYDYERVYGACCENVVGYMPLPVGVAGPLIIDGIPYHIPMATTEGCLVASTMRGCKALNAGGGVQTVLTSDGMTRGPCVRFPTLSRAGACKMYLDSEDGQKAVKNAFNSTSRFARLQHVKTAMAGTLLFIRFKTTTGDAMGMNMISKGCEKALNFMQEKAGFEDMDVISLSGNYCTDKKPAAINWIEGRGKSVVACSIVPAAVVTKVLKSDVDALIQLNIDKNLVGSAMAGSVGGNNAQAANLVTAVYLATGQDPAQNVESSNCITLMEKTKTGDLQISVSMPSIEVGTIGGGTILEAQGAMLDLLGVRGPHPTQPGANAQQLAKVVASAVLAAELSLCSALAAGHLVRSHMQHNRKPKPAATIAAAPATTPAPAAPGASAASAPSAAAAAPAPAKADGKANGKADAADVQRLQQGSKICIRS